MRVPYKEIALFALVKWNGISEKEAQVMIEKLSIGELEEKVFAKKSVNHAIDSIAQRLNLRKDEKEAFTIAVYYGPENAPIFAKVGQLLQNQGDIETLVLDILSDIHDGWVVDNSDEKTFNKKKDRKQLRQYLPLPLIGYNEVESDLVFLKPILASCGIDTDLLRLEESYHNGVDFFIRNNDLTSFDKLLYAISEGREFYPVLPSTLESKLVPLSEEILVEVLNNWKENDKKSALIFINALQDESGIKSKKIR